LAGVSPLLHCVPVLKDLFVKEKWFLVFWLAVYWLRLAAGAPVCTARGREIVSTAGTTAVLETSHRGAVAFAWRVMMDGRLATTAVGLQAAGTAGRTIEENW